MEGFGDVVFRDIQILLFIVFILVYISYIFDLEGFSSIMVSILVFFWEEFIFLVEGLGE